MTMQLDESIMQACTGARYGVLASKRGGVLRLARNAVKSLADAHSMRWIGGAVDIEAELTYKIALDLREHGQVPNRWCGYGCCPEMLHSRILGESRPTKVSRILKTALVRQ